MINVDQLNIIELIDEQSVMKFTGKIKILDKINFYDYGQILLIDGAPVACQYETTIGIKSFFRLLIDQVKIRPLKFDLLPFEIKDEERNIHLPYPVLKTRSQNMMDEFESSLSGRPPSDVKIMIRPEFIESGSDVSELEYSLMCTLSDWNSVSEIYSKSSLIDYEVTYALIGLRKKNALIIKGRLGDNS